MKSVILIALLLFSIPCFAQELLSTYKPRTQTEKRVIAKLKALPEIVQHYEQKSQGKRDVMINTPDANTKEYSFQVGTNFGDRFSTNYYLYIDPKTFKIYFLDYMDESLGKSITLEQWRYWRNKPGFHDIHKWVDGKLVVLKEKKHVPKKSSHS